MSEDVRLVQVAALARDGTIGKDGGMPWHYPEDLRHFRRVTSETALLMGRRTMQSIGRPLPGRPNLVISRDPESVEKQWPGVRAFSSFDEAIQAVAESGFHVLSVVGGAEIYTQTQPKTSELVLSFIPEDGGGDTYYPIREWSDLADVQAARRLEREMSILRVVVALLRYQCDAPTRNAIARVATELLVSVAISLELVVQDCEKAIDQAQSTDRNIDAWGQEWVASSKYSVGDITVMHYVRR